eukprot:5683262-Pyramimonas_sp.AAC.1
MRAAEHATVTAALRTLATKGQGEGRSLRSRARRSQSGRFVVTGRTFPLSDSLRAGCRAASAARAQRQVARGPRA